MTLEEKIIQLSRLGKINIVSPTAYTRYSESWTIWCNLKDTETGDKFEITRTGKDFMATFNGVYDASMRAVGLMPELRSDNLIEAQLADSDDEIPF